MEAETGPEAACFSLLGLSDNCLKVQNEDFFVVQSNKLDYKGP